MTNDSVTYVLRIHCFRSSNGSSRSSVFCAASGGGARSSFKPSLCGRQNVRDCAGDGHLAFVPAPSADTRGLLWVGYSHHLLLRCQGPAFSPVRVRQITVRDRNTSQVSNVHPNTDIPGIWAPVSRPKTRKILSAQVRDICAQLKLNPSDSRSCWW